MIRINLLLEPSEGRRNWLPDTAQTGHYAILLLALTVIGMGFWYWSLLERQADNITLIERLGNERLALKAIEAEVEQYKAQKAQLDARIAAIDQLRENQRGPVTMMNSIIASIPPGKRLWLTNLTQKANIVAMEGRALEVPVIADLIANLETQPAFRHVELEFWEEDEDNIKFKLNCEVQIG